MSMAEWPVWASAAVFAASAAMVWVAGTRIARYADAIAEATGIGRAVLGMLLLGGVTSLPELAVASTAAVAGYPALSVNDVLGSAAINVLIIALADAAIGRNAITSVLASPAVLLQGVLGIVLLAIAAAGALSVPLAFAGASVWTWLMAATYGAAAWILAHTRSARAWRAEPPPREPASLRRRHDAKPLIAKTMLAGAVILVAGYFLTQSGHALAQRTGLGTNFFGAVALAASTSLPEVSTVIAAVRLKRYEMAVSDIFGTNLFNVVILFVADLLYAGPPVLAEVGAFAAFGALLAIVLTALFLAGMLERRDRTVLRMGMDSLAAIGVYSGGLFVLYQLR